jgi:hypothetical protein
MQTLTRLASGNGTDVSSAANIPFEDNKVYEHRIECVALPDVVAFFSNVQGTLNSNGAELVDQWYEGNTVVYQFRKMSGAQGLIAPIVISIVIGAVLLLIALLVIRWTLDYVAVPVAWDILKIALIGFGVVLVIAGAVIVLRKSGVKVPDVGKDIVGAAKSAVGTGTEYATRGADYVKRRIIEEF